MGGVHDYFNFMHGGIDSLEGIRQWDARAQEPNAAQLESITRLYLDADEFIGDELTKFPNKDWGRLLADKQLSYDGSVVARAQELTLEQVLPSLPPKGVACSVASLDLAPPRLQRFLTDPSHSIKPRKDWPAKLARCRMRISREEWKLLGVELVARGICKPIPKSALVFHNGRALLNAIFGVGKNAYIINKAGVRVEILRLICNLVLLK